MTTLRGRYYYYLILTNKENEYQEFKWLGEDYTVNKWYYEAGLWIQAEKEYLIHYVIPPPCKKLDFYLESNDYH